MIDVAPKGTVRNAARARHAGRACALLVVGVASVGAVVARAAPTEDSIPVPTRLQQMLPDLLQQAGIPGASAAWVEKGQVAWTGAFGVRSAETEIPVERETVFEAASLSKPVVAYLAMRLVARGDLDLDAPLWDAQGYDRLAHDDRARQITARMVLTHTSGLPNWGGTPLELNSDPGTAWNYSGEGFVYLATMLERRTGRSLDELAHQEVFGPLGMPSSSFVWQEEYEQTAAAPHDLVGRPNEKNRPQDANAAASLHTTAEDYARFVLAVMKGEGLTATAARDMLRAQADIAGWGNQETWEHLSWGLGWGIQHGEAQEAIWHWGDNGDFRCFVMAYPSRGEAFVVFTNSRNGLSVVGGLLDEVFEDTHWSMRYLGYPAWDKPRQVARRALQRSFLVEGEGWPALRRLAREFPANVAENETQRVANALESEGESAASLAVLEWAAERFASAASQRALGEAYTARGNFGEAVARYEEATAIDPDFEAELAPRMQWLRDGLAAEASSYQPSGDELEAFVGTYGPRTIAREDGRLIYSREGASSNTPLVPLAPDLFALEDNSTFRMRFERDEDGRVVGIVGLYSDGRSDRSERSD